MNSNASPGGSGGDWEPRVTFFVEDNEEPSEDEIRVYYEDLGGSERENEDEWSNRAEYDDESSNRSEEDEDWMVEWLWREYDITEEDARMLVQSFPHLRTCVRARQFHDSAY